MCLAFPAKVVEVYGNETALVDFGGVRKLVSAALLEEVAVGDYVIVHVGFALSKLDIEEAERTLQIFAEEVAEEAEGISEFSTHASLGGSLNGGRPVSLH